MTRPERGGYPAGDRAASGLPPPPGSVVRHDGWEDVPLPGLAAEPAMDAGRPVSWVDAPPRPRRWEVRGEEPDQRLPPVTEVKRLRLAPGDSLVVRCPQPLPAAVVHRLEAIVRRVLRVPAGTPVLVLDNGVDIDVVETSRGGT